MKIFNHDTQYIAIHYMSDLINGDSSGLYDDDEKLIEDYLKQYEGFYVTFDIEDEEEEPHFTRCAISNSRSDCIGVSIYLELIHKDNEINYVPDLFFYSVETTDTPRHNSSTGYGSKIPTQYLLHCADGYKRRVYARCYGNAASMYIVVQGKKFYLHDYQL